MTTRARYQFGCLTRKKRIRSEDVWQFRFYETTVEGRRCRRSRMIGTLAQYPTKADAFRIIERFRCGTRITGFAVWNPASAFVYAEALDLLRIIPTTVAARRLAIGFAGLW